MTQLAKFTMHVTPQALQTSGKRIKVVAGKPLFFKSKTASNYQRTITLISSQHAPRTPHDGPMRVDYAFILPRPGRLNRKSDPAGRIYADNRPDRDNLIKGTQDAILGFWQDDAQIVAGDVSKWYAAKGESPKIEVTIYKLT